MSLVLYARCCAKRNLGTKPARSNEVASQLLGIPVEQFLSNGDCGVEVSGNGPRAAVTGAVVICNRESSRSTSLVYSVISRAFLALSIS